MTEAMSEKRRKVISHKRFNPNYYHLRVAMDDENIRFIFLRGGSSSAKSYSVAQAILIECIKHGTNTMVYKKTSNSIDDSIYKSFKQAARKLKISELFTFMDKRIVCMNGSEITFSGMDDPEKIKGLESYKRIVLEELTGFDHEDLKQTKKRLRGMRGQQIIGMFNPISEEHWIKKEVFDKEKLVEVDNHLYGIIKNPITKEFLPKEYTTIRSKWKNSSRYITNPNTGKEELHPADMVILHSTYLNNFWVVGSPDGTYGYYDRQTVADFEKDKERDYNYYKIYALGDWGSIKTGGEFFASFDGGKHIGAFPYTPGKVVHVSIDNNQLPYIAVTFWQHEEVDGVRWLRQVHEICAADPFNTVTKAAEMSRLWLDGTRYDDVVYLHGDVTTKSGNTIDDEKRSFADKFIEGLEVNYRVVDLMQKSNPRVAMSGEFINAILSDGFGGLRIGIDRECKASIRDYENVKKDVDGSVWKKRIKDKVSGLSYEEFGHLTDTFRYVCVDVFKEEFTKFSLKRKRNSFKNIEDKEDSMKYYNVEAATERKARVIYVMPLVNEKFVLVCGDVHEYVDVLDVAFCDSMEKDALIAKLKSLSPDIVSFECDKPFFPMVRDVREAIEDINVRGGAMAANRYNRISANEELIKSRFRFRSDYDNDPEYARFMDNVMDYNGKDNYEAISCLSGMCAYVNRMYFSD